MSGDGLGDAVGHGHVQTMRSDSLVGIGQSVRNRAVLEGKSSHQWSETASDGDVSGPGVVGDQGHEAMVPSLTGQVERTVERVEAGLFERGRVTDVV